MFLEIVSGVLVMNVRLLLLASIIAVVSSAAQTTNAQDTAPLYKRVGYFTSYSIYSQQYFVTDIPVQFLTHLNYYAINISQNGQCVSGDQWADTQFSYAGDKPTERLRGNFKQLQLLKKNNPNLKILMTIGGWDQSRYFSDVAATHDARIRFVRSCIAFMRDNKFDGIDIDWRYPVNGGKDDNDYSPDDSANLTLLLAEFRGQLDYWSNRDNKSYLLTMALNPAFYTNFQLTQVQGYIDWINLMAYGFEGDWSKIASPFSPLYGSSKDPRGDKARLANSVEGAVKECLDAGVPADKIVLGLGLYAQAWSSVKSNDLFGMYEPVQGVPAGTRPGGILYYRDLLPLLTSDSYTRFFDNETKTPWLYSEARKVAISYEDQESIHDKAAYVTDMGLGGVMFWELSFDDDAHTLLQAANDALNAPAATPTQ